MGVAVVEGSHLLMFSALFSSLTFGNRAAEVYGAARRYISKFWSLKHSLSFAETYQLSGDFEKDFCELCQRNSISPIKVVPRPHRPSSPQISHPETSISKGGKESKEGKILFD